MANSLQDEIIEDYYDFFAREGKAPNELHITKRQDSEFEQLIQRSIGCWKSDPFGKIKHWWYMGMRVFSEIWSFGVGWSKETEEIKQALKEKDNESL